MLIHNYTENQVYEHLPPQKKRFLAFLEDCTPCLLLLIYYWGMSFDTAKYQEMQSYSFDGAFS